MSKKKRDRGSGIGDQNKEKPVFGSGAEPLPEPKGDGFVKCVCTVACAWKGYHDEGDKVFIKRELIEKDAFIKAHFKEVKSEELRVKSSDSGEGGGTDRDGTGDERGGGDDSVGRGGRDGTGEERGEVEGQGECEGYGELELK